MAFIQPTGQLRTAVSTYSALPLTANVLGDLRTVNDLGLLYTWLNVSSSGSLSDWHKVSVSSYADLQGRPNSTVLAIDNAVASIRNIFLNYILIFFITSVNYSMSVMKMLNGVMDRFLNEDAVDLTKTSGQRYVLAQGITGLIGYYKNNFDGSLDQYTQILIHGYDFVATNFFDDLYNEIVSTNVTTDSSITKFGNKSFVFSTGKFLSYFTSSFNTNQDNNPFVVNGVDFAWDFQLRCDTNAAETIMVDSSFNHEDGTNFKIEKTAEQKIKVTFRGATTYDWDNQLIPHNPVTYTVTGATTITSATWYHVAVVRESGYIKLYINGVLDGTSSVADTQNIVNYTEGMNYPSNLCIKIGAGLTGRMEEIRFSKGTPRYTSNFTAPTVAYNQPTQSVPCNNMVIQSEGYEAATIPTSARIVIFEHNLAENVFPLTDLKAYISRDGGTTFTQATDLKIEFDVMQEAVSYYIGTNVNFFVGTVDLTSQPNGQEMVYKITTHNNKNISIRSVGLNWK